MGGTSPSLFHEVGSKTPTGGIEIKRRKLKRNLLKFKYSKGMDFWLWPLY